MRRETVTDMSIKGSVAFALTLALAGSPMLPVVVSAQGNASAQAAGRLGGQATDKAKQPYSDYMVRVHGVNSVAIIQSVPLNAQGQFSLVNLALGQSYLVELFSVKQNKIICTEGPYNLNQTMNAKNDINIDCGKNPAAWLLAAGAGAAILAAATQSSPQ
jgi:hypothetical protein